MKKTFKLIIGIIVIGSMLQTVYAREGTFKGSLGERHYDQIKKIIDNNTQG